MIRRREHRASIRALLDQFPVVGLVGARQVGKTTLARDLINDAAEPVTTFDLEDPTDERRFADPKLALEPLRGLVVIDEVQRSEGLFRLLRVLVDRPGNAVRFLALGSAGPDLLRQFSENPGGTNRLLRTSFLPDQRNRDPNRHCPETLVARGLPSFVSR